MSQEQTRKARLRAFIDDPETLRTYLGLTGLATHTEIEEDRARRAQMDTEPPEGD